MCIRDRIKDELSEMVDLTRREILIFAPLLVLTILIGIFPKPVIDIIEPSTKKIVSQIENKLR